LDRLDVKIVFGNGLKSKLAALGRTVRRRVSPKDAKQPVKKLWILLFRKKRSADEARRRSIPLVGLGLRSSEVAGPFLAKPFGLRSF
jgi:hypothetical protein